MNTDDLVGDLPPGLHRDEPFRVRADAAPAGDPRKAGGLGERSRRLGAAGRRRSEEPVTSQTSDQLRPGVTSSRRGESDREVSSADVVGSQSAPKRRFGRSTAEEATPGVEGTNAGAVTSPGHRASWRKKQPTIDWSAPKSAAEATSKPIEQGAAQRSQTEAVVVPAEARVSPTEASAVQTERGAPADAGAPPERSSDVERVVAPEPHGADATADALRGPAETAAVATTGEPTTAPTVGDVAPTNPPSQGRVEKFRKSAPTVVEIVPLTPTQRIESACLTLVGPELRRMLAVTLPMTLLGVVALWSHAGPGRLLLWAALAVASSVVLGFVAGFETPLDVPGAIVHRRREITIACAAVSVAWGLGVLAVFPSVRPVELRPVLATVTFGAFAAMGLGTLLCRPAMYALVGPATGLTIARFLAGTSTDRMVAVLGLGVAAAFGLHGTKANTTAVTLVRNRIENDLLNRKLQRSLEMRSLLEDELQRAADSDRSDEKDPVTGIRNRRSFLEAVGDHWQQAEAGFDPFTIALIDIDQFDEIREQHGTDVANALLKQVADLVDAGLRTDDKLARVSNSQFSVLLNNALSDGAVICLERIRRKVASTPFDAGQPMVISISSGIVTWDKGVGLKQLMSRSDSALNDAREAGGNRLKVWGTPE